MSIYVIDTNKNAIKISSMAVIKEGSGGSSGTTNVLEPYNVTMYTDENGYNVLALDNKTSAEKNCVVGQLIKDEYSTLYLVNA